MISNKTRPKALTAFLSLMVGISISNCLPALAAPTPTQLVEAVTNAKVLPASVSMNARYNLGEVSLYMYRSGKVPDNDLKIDSVLVTKSLRDKFGQDIKSVQLNFYDKENKTIIRQCTVSQAHINSFSAKQISQQQLLDMLTIARMSAGGSGGSTGGAFNASKQAVLSATAVPGYEQRKREMSLLKIKDLAEKDGNYQGIFTMFKRMEAMVAAGQVEQVGPLFNDIETKLIEEDAIVRQRHSSALQASEGRRIQAEAKAKLLVYNPPWGLGLWRRTAIWNAIKRLHERGDDVSPYMVTLSQTIDKPLSLGNTDAVKAGVIRLEQQLGIPNSPTW